MAMQAIAQSGAISGTVLDEKKQPILGAIIEVTQKGIRKGGAATDEDGKYTIKPLSAGRYEVKISYTSYISKLVKDVIVSPDRTTSVNAQLQLNQKELDEVKVIAYKVPLIDPFSETRTIRSEDIERMPSRNTASVVSTAAGVYQSPGRRAKKDKSTAAAPYQAPVYMNPSNESYKKDAENDFKNVSANPLSTISVDVDRASYSNIRRFINQGQTPPADAVRIEERLTISTISTRNPKGKIHLLL